MIEVIALACTVMAPLQCKNVKLTFATEAVSPMQCMVLGQTELAKWIGEHPGWMISHGFKCAPAGRYAKI